MPCPLCYSLACNAFVLSLETMLACLVLSLYIFSNFYVFIDLLSSYMSCFFLACLCNLEMVCFYSLLSFSSQDIANHVLILLLSVYFEPCAFHALDLPMYSW